IGAALALLLTVVFSEPASLRPPDSTPFQTRRDAVNVQSDYGAVGNGRVDDTRAIRNAMASGARSIYFPAGTYVVDSITVPAGVTQIYGQGVMQAKGSNHVFYLNNVSGLTIQDLTFRGVGGTVPSSDSVAIVVLGNSQRVNIVQNRFQNINAN